MSCGYTSYSSVANSRSLGVPGSNSVPSRSNVKRAVKAVSLPSNAAAALRTSDSSLSEPIGEKSFIGSVKRLLFSYPDGFV